MYIDIQLNYQIPLLDPLTLSLCDFDGSAFCSQICLTNLNKYLINVHTSQCNSYIIFKLVPSEGIIFVIYYNFVNENAIWTLLFENCSLSLFVNQSDRFFTRHKSPSVAHTLILYVTAV